MEHRRFSVSPERYKVVLLEISDGSEPAMRFYIMVALSTMIASFGLITNSTAVIIGAMLVAPLMTPIFGIALALIRSDGVLFGRALKAEIAGVVAAILMGVILGSVYPALEPTPEMIARTKPQLFDLLIAVFSGLAGAYALLDEKISPALPGVAIATAIVPPLANTGLCFALGEYAAGVGSFLLFFANFLSILLVASVAFWLFGMAGNLSKLDKKTLIKRFWFPTCCFILVAIFLTNTLMSIARQNHIQETVLATLEQHLLQFQDTVLDGAKHNERDGVIYVLAEVHSSGAMSPIHVASLEKRIENALNQETSLIVRTKLAKEISAIGANIQLRKQKLDGSFISQSVPPHVKDAKIVDTTIRNFLASMAGYTIDKVRTFEVDDTSIFLATIHGVTAPNQQNIEEIEALLRQELGRSNVRLVFNFIHSSLYDRSGLIRLEFSGLLPSQGSQGQSVIDCVDFLKKELTAMSEVAVSGVNYDVVDGSLFVLIDTLGPKILSPEEVNKLQELATRKVGIPVELFIHMKTETVVTSIGHESFSVVSRDGFGRQLPSIKEDVREIMLKANM
ncbi:MAG: DUF389 domain-containing protein [Desulfocapsaceae bacterium]